MKIKNSRNDKMEVEVKKTGEKKTLYFNCRYTLRLDEQEHEKIAAWNRRRY
jgi:endonuclease I